MRLLRTGLRGSVEDEEGTFRGFEITKPSKFGLAQWPDAHQLMNQGLEGIISFKT